MLTTNHGEHLFQLARFPGIFPVNCYFIRGDEGLTLIDAGLPGMGKLLLAAAKELEAPLVRVLLTHAHSDHLGALAELRELQPRLPFFISTRDARILAGDHSLDANEPQTKLRGGLTTLPFAPDGLFNAGDRFGPLEVIAAPGHTPGHVAFFDRRDRSLIAGDAFQTHPSLTVSGVVRWRFPFPALATWHRPTALASARHLLGYRPERLAVGHGPILEKSIAAMEQAILHAEQRQKERPDGIARWS